MTRQFQCLILTIIASVSGLRSQYYFYNDKFYNSPLLVEAGLSIGGMNCLTDLGGKDNKGNRFITDINWNQSHPCAGVYIALLFEQVLGVRAELAFGRVSSSDKVLKDLAKDRYRRNLHFRSNIRELSLRVEIFPFSLLSAANYPLLSPYVVGGIGFFRFNPKAQLTGNWISLHPLHTEGQGLPEYPHKQIYKLTQIAFPLGIGLRYELSALVNLRLEVIYRFLNTDYLDDVSTTYVNPAAFHTNLLPPDALNAQLLADRSYELRPGVYMKEGDIRGNPEKKDGYFSCDLKIGFTFNRKRR